MSQSFKRKLSKDVGSTFTKIGAYDVPASTTAICIGLLVGNSDNTDVYVDIVLTTSGAVDYYLGNELKIPAGQSLIVIGWDQKVVLETGDSIRVRTNDVGDNTKNVDCILSVMEMS